jgi:hypothetical protein
MKTTLEIADPTFRRAKTYAASKGITLKQLISEALEDKLHRLSHPDQAAELAGMTGFGAFGKTPADRAETRRIQRRIDREFEQIDAEDRP